MSTQDKVQLSERERQQLAGIKAMLESGDPRLARVLTGQKGRLGTAMEFVNGAVRSGASRRARSFSAAARSSATFRWFWRLRRRGWWLLR